LTLLLKPFMPLAFGDLAGTVERALARDWSLMADLRQGKAVERQERAVYPADMRQDRRTAAPQDTPRTPAYQAALAALAEDLDHLCLAVARDVTGSAEPPAEERAAARTAVEWLVASLARGSVPRPNDLRSLRDDAAARARAGEPLQPVLDRALSAGWVVWAALTVPDRLPAPALAALGEALLRTGDAAAAAIADAHAAAVREAATRSATALREVLDRLLELPEGDEPARALLARRLGELGVPVDRPATLVLADLGSDLEDGDAVVGEVARALAAGPAATVGDPRALAGPVPGPVVAAAGGRLVVIAPAGRRQPDVERALSAAAPGFAAVTSSAGGLLDAAVAHREARAALAVVERAGVRGHLVDARSVLLERALLAEPGLLRTAVDRELAPLRGAPRGGALVATLEAYLAERENVRAAGRRLGIAPRTVAYRLERIERLLGGPLDAPRRLRLAAVLFARDLLDAPETPAV
jgi:hypothetical protein